MYDILNCGPNRRFVVWGDGPIIVHNCVQAISRDLLVYALRLLEEAGLKTVLHVHDSCLIEAPIGDIETVERVHQIMESLPPWAEGLPLKAETIAARRMA